MDKRKLITMKKEYKPGDKVLVELEVIKQYSDSQLYCKSKADGNFHIFPASIEQPFEPREMMVWNNEELNCQKRKVIGKFNNVFVVEEKALSSECVIWKHAKELPKELENGKVYKNKFDDILFKTGKDTGWGFSKTSYINNYYACRFSFDKEEDEWREYPLLDFKELIIVEAYRRRFKPDTWVDRKELKLLSYDRIVKLYSNNTDFTIEDNEFKFKMSGNIIFKDGVWAKVIE